MKNKLSADPASLILGITSLVIIFFGCCCGIFTLISLGLSITGLVLANKSISEYYEYPDVYAHTSKKNVEAGKIICIIGTVVSSLFVLISLIFFFIYGSLLSSSAFKDFYKQNTNQVMEDTVTVSPYERVEEDTLYRDTIAVDTIRKNY